MQRKHRAVSIALSTPVAIILILWGIPGMIEDAIAWQGWIGNVWSWLSETPTVLSWVLVAIGLIILYKPQRLLQRKSTQVGQAIRESRPQLIHDSVLWEDGGNNMWGNIDVIGPLCPKDLTPLAKKRGDKVETYLDNDTLISDSGYHCQLICPECNAEYTLGEKPKVVRDSIGEVHSLLEGKRRRQDG